MIHNKSDRTQYYQLYNKLMNVLFATADEVQKYSSLGSSNFIVGPKYVKIYD